MDADHASIKCVVQMDLDGLYHIDHKQFEFCTNNWLV